MNQTPIGVGIIGCGEVAQLMHLPFIDELAEFRPVALCDISPGTMAAVGERFHVAGRYTDHRALLADPSVEAVVVCTYDHGAIVRDCIAAGKHVIVEKPLAFTPEEARPLVAAAAEKGVVALVGYMKLHDGGFLTGVERIRAMGRPRSIQIHDFAGRFDRYGSLYTLARASDVPPEAMKAARAAVDARILAALGERHGGYLDLYLILLMLGSHDLAVMRAAFGPPERIAYARATGPQHLLAVLDFPGGVPCVFEIGVGAQYEWWDEWIAVHGDTDIVRIEFPNPYLRQGQTLVRIREAAGETSSERVIIGTADNPFRREWRHFADCIAGRADPRSDLAGGLADLELALAIIHAMPPLPSIGP